jgi:hypothetical protein
MSRRYYRRRRKNDGISGTLLLVGIIALVLFIQFKRSQHEKQKLRALI